MKAAAHDRIVAAALELIAEQGLGGVTIAGVARAAGVARQTLYNHFPDLDSVLVAVIEQHAGDSLRQLEALLATAPDPVAKLDLLIRHCIATAGHGGDVAGMTAGLSPAARQQVVEHGVAYRRLIEGVIAEGSAAGVFRSQVGVGAAALVVERMTEAAPELVVEVGSASRAAEAVREMVLGSLGRK